MEVEAPRYAEFRNEPDLLPLYRANAERLGRQFAPAESPATDGAGGAGAGSTAAAGRMNRASTDMGNVSLIGPSIPPYIGIGPLPPGNPQQEIPPTSVPPAAPHSPP